MKADTETKPVTAYEVTPANIHDSRVLENLMENVDFGQPLYADSSYRSESLEVYCSQLEIESWIHEKGYWNKPLQKLQKAANKRKSKMRARVEQIFAFM